MSDIEIDPATLSAAARTWADQADQLRGAVASLEEITSSAVGPRPTSELAAFRRHWVDRLTGLQQTAQEHAAAIEGVLDGMTVVDQERAADLTGLLPRATTGGTP